MPTLRNKYFFEFISLTLKLSSGTDWDSFFVNKLSLNKLMSFAETQSLQHCA